MPRVVSVVPKRPNKGLKNPCAQEEEHVAQASVGAGVSAFQRFAAGARAKDESVHKPRMILLATTKLLSSVRTWNPNFRYDEADNPRRVLTRPETPAKNDGRDNSISNLIIRVGDVLFPDKTYMEFRGFRVLDMLGQGTFGQVVLCEDCMTKEKVAVKVIKNKRAYNKQAQVELMILSQLNQTFDSDGRGNIVRMLRQFSCKDHLCFVFERLSVNLYELIKRNRFRGLSCNLVRTFMKHLLKSLNILAEAKIIHCDLKPENILLESRNSARIKLIDFGSACFEGQTVYPYIQSRFYRSPEVLLGMSYNSAIDMWSLGCIAAELLLGLPLFPGATAYNQVARIVKSLGPVPAFMVEQGSKGHVFFERSSTDPNQWALKDAARVAQETNTEAKPIKKYFRETALKDLFMNYPLKKELKPAEKERELTLRKLLLHFVSGLLKYSPSERWTASEAAEHPFITSEGLDDIPRFEQRISRRRAEAAAAKVRKGSRLSPKQQNPDLERFYAGPSLRMNVARKVGQVPLVRAEPTAGAQPSPGAPGPLEQRRSSLPPRDGAVRLVDAGRRKSLGAPPGFPSAPAGFPSDASGAQTQSRGGGIPRVPTKGGETRQGEAARKLSPLQRSGHALSPVHVHAFSPIKSQAMSPQQGVALSSSQPHSPYVYPGVRWKSSAARSRSPWSMHAQQPGDQRDRKLKQLSARSLRGTTSPLPNFFGGMQLTSSRSPDALSPTASHNTDSHDPLSPAEHDNLVVDATGGSAVAVDIKLDVRVDRRRSGSSAVSADGGGEPRWRAMRAVQSDDSDPPPVDDFDSWDPGFMDMEFGGTPRQVRTVRAMSGDSEDDGKHQGYSRVYPGSVIAPSQPMIPQSPYFHGTPPGFVDLGISPSQFSYHSPQAIRQPLPAYAHGMAPSGRPHYMHQGVHRQAPSRLLPRSQSYTGVRAPPPGFAGHPHPHRGRGRTRPAWGRGRGRRQSGT